jgi:hypothetical protein
MTALGPLPVQKMRRHSDRLMAPKPIQRLRIDPMFIGCGSLNLSPEILVRSIAFTDRRKLYFKPNWDSQKGIEGSFIKTSRNGIYEA